MDTRVCVLLNKVSRNYEKSIARIEITQYDSGLSDSTASYYLFVEDESINDRIKVNEYNNARYLKSHYLYSGFGKGAIFCYGCYIIHNFSSFYDDLLKVFAYDIYIIDFEKSLEKAIESR